MSELVAEVEKAVEPLLSQANVELVDLTYQKGPGGWTLCFFLDKPGGITLDDCTYWSDQIGQVLDQSGLISHAYSLEVSSPGLNRPLKKMADFQRFKGQKISVRLYAALEGQKNFHGQLTDTGLDEIQMKLEDNRDVRLPFKQIARARLEPDIKI